MEPGVVRATELGGGRRGSSEPGGAGGAALELGGVLLGGLAWLCSLASTLMWSWLSLSSDLLPAESFSVGLWGACVLQEGGATACRPFDGLLGLPPPLALARGLMLASLAAGLLGLLLAVPGLRAVKGGGGRKRALRGAGGALSGAAGALGLAPPSFVAQQAVQHFFDASLPELLPRWELGDALFCGWAAALLYLAAAGVLLTSCLRGGRGGRGEPPPERARPPAASRCEYV